MASSRTVPKAVLRWIRAKESYLQPNEIPYLDFSHSNGLAFVVN